MTISEAKLAEGLLAYLQNHKDDFQKFLLAQSGIKEGDVSCEGDPQKKRVLVKIGILDYGRAASEQVYSIKIEKTGASEPIGSHHGN